MWFVSPFMSKGVADVLAEAAALSDATDRRMLTALVENSVRFGVLDPKGLRRLKSAGFELASIRNLHAKVTVVDQWGLVGSGNLTRAGLGGTKGNVELGVVLDGRQVRSAVKIFDEWWRAAEPIEFADIDAFDRIKRVRGGSRTGKTHGPELPVPEGRELERKRAEREPAKSGRGLWMKAAYFDPATDQPGWWLRDYWISDGTDPGYQVGDLIVLYLGGANSPRCCPALLEVRAEPVHDPAKVDREAKRGEGLRWPWVTAVECVHDAPIDLAPHPRDFGIDPRSLQAGYRHLPPERFREAVALIRAASASR